MIEIFDIAVRGETVLQDSLFDFQVRLDVAERSRWEELDRLIGERLFRKYKFVELLPELFALIKEEQGREGLLSAIQEYGKIGLWLDKLSFLFEEELENGISVFDTLDVKERCRAFFAHCLIGLMKSGDDDIKQMPKEIRLFVLRLEQALHNLQCE
ncbi:hypothetical protein ACFSKY_23760 [Azotobacter chroococcum]|uniref:Uncharacterized protein n=1 Tax=Azotobacter chroococcum TaxID=353 RepID=A0A4V2Q599_9GAMM|nr:hypothetical protein [Azotobacter chroococcum]TBV93875.1 hypothetical protein E0E53_16015 [Azotobacter chroococcum]TCL18516.1 hypothetical protein EV691_14715 [Azotobacter chroococcum]